MLRRICNWCMNACISVSSVMSFCLSVVLCLCVCLSVCHNFHVHTRSCRNSPSSYLRFPAEPNVWRKIYKAGVCTCRPGLPRRAYKYLTHRALSLGAPAWQDVWEESFFLDSHVCSLDCRRAWRSVGFMTGGIVVPTGAAGSSSQVGQSRFHLTGVRLSNAVVGSERFLGRTQPVRSYVYQQYS